MLRITAVAAPVLVALAALAGCESLDSKAEFPGDDIYGRPTAPGAAEEATLFGGIGFGLGDGSNEEAGAQLPVNKFLWRATLDTLAFLPLASTDPYGGVIVTDWGATPQSPAERFKVSAFITSAALKPQSLRVVVNKQQKDDLGQWVAAPVAPETSRKLENAILTRARQIKIENADDT